MAFTRHSCADDYGCFVYDRQFGPPDGRGELPPARDPENRTSERGRHRERSAAAL